MLLHDDLLQVARQLAGADNDASQAGLRRAVSTAYYALFHLLITEATRNWGRPELRSRLARVFDHGPMRKASEVEAGRIERMRKAGKADASSWDDLRKVASLFVEAQDLRIQADYDAGAKLDPNKVRTHVERVADAFQSWSRIREEPSAQAYLVSLLARRPGEPRVPLSAQLSPDDPPPGTPEAGA